MSVSHESHLDLEDFLSRGAKGLGLAQVFVQKDTRAERAPIELSDGRVVEGHSVTGHIHASMHSQKEGVWLTYSKEAASYLSYPGMDPAEAKRFSDALQAEWEAHVQAIQRSQPGLTVLDGSVRPVG